jgi:hypothetical protein
VVKKTASLAICQRKVRLFKRFFAQVNKLITEDKFEIQIKNDLMFEEMRSARVEFRKEANECFLNHLGCEKK